MSGSAEPAMKTKTYCSIRERLKESVNPPPSRPFAAVATVNFRAGDSELGSCCCCLGDENEKDF